MSDAEQPVLENLLNEYVERLRRGELPSISAYEAAHPKYAKQIRELFPAARMMEQIALSRQHSHGPAVVAAGSPPAQLGDFRIIREIGRGGMGIVYEAEQESLSRHVAVKVLPPSALLNPVSLQRFQREARTAAQLHHTNIVPVFGVGEQQGFHYLVMQLIQGVGLDKILAQLAQDYSARRSPIEFGDGGATRECHGQLVRPCLASAGEQAASGTQPPQQTTFADKETNVVAAVAQVLLQGEFCRAGAAADLSVRAATNVPRCKEEPASLSGYWRSVAQIGAQAADALHYAHQRGTLHRDIKPANLLVDRQGVVWISDFGLAKAIEHDEVSQAGDIVGTLRYMAPERFRGEADARSDIYSLGLTLYELLTLRPAYEQSSPSDLILRIVDGQPVRPRAVNPAIPADLETIVLKAVAREPAHRYPSAGELADDLARFLEDRPIRARRLGLAERLWRWSRRNRALASLIGLAATLLILLALVASVAYVRTARANAQVREALAGQSQQREKAEAVSALTLEALDDIFEQYVPNRVSGAGELSLNDSEGVAVRLPAQPVLSKGAAALLERMLVFYDRLARQNVAGAALRWKVADANRRVGDIHRRLGHFEQAQAAYLKAIHGYQQLQQEAAGDATAATEIARIDNDLGDLHWAARWEGIGRSFHATAMEVLMAAPPAQSALPQHRYELARTCYFLGRGGPPEAAPGRGPKNDGRKRFPSVRRSSAAASSQAGGGPPNPTLARRDDEENLQHAIQILEHLIEEHPSTADYRHLLACCYRELPVERAESPQKPAFNPADKAIEILRKLVADFPDVPDYRFDLSKTYAKLQLNDWPSDTKLCAAMEGRLRQSLSLSEKLILENPNMPEYSASHVHSLYMLTEVLRHSRRPDEAETTLRKALALQSSLAEQFPAVNSYVVWTAILQESLAKMLANRGRSQEARTLLESAVTALNRLLKSDPRAAYVHGMLGRCYQNLADVLSEMGEAQQAAEILQRGKEHHPDR